ncbi:unnamed protein product [Clavelina lepadiformis]|uniref:NADH dehydrogenase [ubiquinone] 1 beta subcomplex subunit 2, mitochondrial n=1 Tax=Clavelina lepadiformis TaxID=159417 RepID=A0ABP0GLS3_CLALP
MLMAARLGRGISVLRCLRSGIQLPSALKPQVHNKIILRQGGTSRIGYRCAPPDDPIIEFTLDAVGTLFWCYMFWMYYHNAGHLVNQGVGYHEYEDATDTQLGIE